MKQCTLIIVAVLLIGPGGGVQSEIASPCLDAVARRVKADDTVTVTLVDGRILRGIAASVGINSNLALSVVSDSSQLFSRTIVDASDIDRISFEVPCRTYGSIGMLMGLVAGIASSHNEAFRLYEPAVVNVLAWGTVGGVLGYLLDWRHTRTVEISCHP